MTHLERFFDKIFEAQRESFPMDIYTENDSLVFELDAAGYTQDTIEAETKDGVLTIHFKDCNKTEDRYYYVKTLPRNDRKLRFAIPSQYNSEKAVAVLSQGILKIVFYKKEELKKNKLTIATDEKGSQ